MDSERAAADRLAALLAGGSDGQPLTDRVCRAAVTLLPVSGAAISVSTGTAQLGAVSASDDLAARIEELQFTVGEGPGLAAFQAGSPVLVADLADPTDPVSARWPGFTAGAGALGLRAVFAFPLHIGAIALGALDLYRASPGLLDRAALTEALLVADAAALALLDLRAARSGDGIAAGMAARLLDGASFYRSEVHQAAGMIMVQLGVAVDTALVRLRAFAFAADRPIGEVARDVVGRQLRLDADNE